MITPHEKRALLISFSLAAVSGALITIIDKFFQLELEWGSASHPALAYMKGLHYMATPFVLVSIGFIVKDHIKKKVRHFKKETRRISGLSILMCIFLLCLSGQALLFITNEDLKIIDQYIHRITGMITVIALLIHLKFRIGDQP